MHEVLLSEIARRQEIVDSKEAKFAKAVELRAEADTLETEASAIDTETLVAEIEELKAYLPVEENNETSVEA